MLRAHAENLWTSDAPLRLLGVSFGVRATLIRLSGGGLWIHCPIPLSPELRAGIETLGPVRHLVAANRHHHFYLEENARAFPEARVHLAPLLEKKHPGIANACPLGSELPWREDLDQVFLAGWPMANETVFHHRESKTAILTDLCFNLREPRHPLERIALKLMGAHDRLGLSRLVRATVRDRPALRSSLDRMLAWDFERLILAHGEIIEKGGRQRLRDALAAL